MSVEQFNQLSFTQCIIIGALLFFCFCLADHGTRRRVERGVLDRAQARRSTDLDLVEVIYPMAVVLRDTTKVWWPTNPYRSIAWQLQRRNVGGVKQYELYIGYQTSAFTHRHASVVFPDTFPSAHETLSVIRKHIQNL